MDQPSKKVIISLSSGTIVRSILLILLFLILFLLRDIVLIILTAVVIASAIEPATKWFTHKRVPRVLAVAVIYLIVIAIIFCIFYFILPSFLVDLAGFMNMLPHYITTLNIKSHGGMSSDFLGWKTAVQGLSQSGSIGNAAQNITTTITTASGSLLTALTTFFGGAISFIMILVISFYLAVQDEGIEQFLIVITPLHHEEYVVNLWHRTQHKIGRWIQGQLILAVIVGLMVFSGLTILHVKHALFLAIISTFFEIIPVFGPIIGSVPGILVGFMSGGMTFGLILAGMYLIIQQIESNVIYPLVVRKIVGVPPLIVIIALIVGAELGGFLGILLSVPIAAGLTEFLDDLKRNRVAARERVTVESIEKVVE